MCHAEPSRVAVLVFTCDRLQMLGDALRSVRRQSARAAVGRVVVSENSPNGQSREVCREFADLPIVYTQHAPPVPALSHAEAVWHQVETPLVAFLHDDDWWAPEHLKTALDALNADERCVAAFRHFLPRPALAATRGSIAASPWRGSPPEAISRSRSGGLTKRA